MTTAFKSNADRLLKRAQKGGPEALGPLFQLYANYLKLLATTQIDRQLQARVSPSDVVQETFFEAQRDFKQFRGGSEAEFLAWLRRILVHNLARSVERHLLAEKRSMRREIPLERINNALDRSSERLESVLFSPGTSPVSDIARREHAVILADEMAELPRHYREVLVLRHLEGMPFSEIAERIGKSAGAARMLWLRAVDQLRQALTAKGVHFERIPE